MPSRNTRGGPSRDGPPLRPAPLEALGVFAVAETAGPVIAAELGPIRLAIRRVAVLVLVVLGSVLDLILRAVHEYRLGVGVVVAKHTGRQQDLLAKNPKDHVHD